MLMATRKFTTDPDDGFFDEDSMPVVCDCGNWFELLDGHNSKYSNHTICEECYQREREEEDE